MKPKVDKEKCIGCGTCTLMAPGSFKMEDDGKASFIDGSTDDEATIKTAADSCPVQAISLD